jgi:hypothetical protein
MSEHEHDPELDPEQERHLRALLADLGSTGGGAERLPDDVALRLEDTLAGLVAERSAVPARSRSRWLPRLAVAAAAVVVLGLGGVATIHLSRSGGENSTADSAAGGGSAGSAGSEAQSPSPLYGANKLAQAVPGLSSSGFAREVAALVGSRPGLRAPAAEDTSSARTASPGADSTCAGPAVTDGARVTPVSLDAAPAALVVHPAKGGKRLVEAWSCGGAHRLASTTIAP